VDGAGDLELRGQLGAAPLSFDLGEDARGAPGADACDRSDGGYDKSED
jgi:hypothetical protein